MKLNIEGLISAPFTPLKPNEEVNLDIIPDYADCLINQGVKHVYILGTTGEGMSLSVAERKLVAEAWKKTNKMETIMVHIGNSESQVQVRNKFQEQIQLPMSRNWLRTLKKLDATRLPFFLRFSTSATISTVLYFTCSRWDKQHQRRRLFTITMLIKLAFTTMRLI